MKDDMKKIYSKMNFWACITAMIVAFCSLAVNIAIQCTDDSFLFAFLIISIILAVIGVVAVILMIVSRVKLRKTEKNSKSDDGE